MKLLIRLALVFVLVVVVGAFGLNWFLSKGLKPAFDKARPMIEEKLGATLEIDDLSVQVLQGRLSVDGIRLGNPTGFEQTPHLFTLTRALNQINLGDLILKQQVTIDEIRVEDSNLYLVRKADGSLNLEALLANLQPAEKPAEDVPPPPAEEVPPPPAEEPAPTQLPPFMLERLLVTSALAFTQELENKDPLKLAVDVKVEADGIGTVGDPSMKTGQFKVTGNLSGNKELFVMNLAGKVAPVTDPTAPTFELNGQIESLEMKILRAFAQDINLADGMIDLRLQLAANAGVFAETSEMVLHIANPKFGEGFDLPARAVPAALSVVVPIRGTLMEPKISFADALAASIRTTLLGAPTEALKAEAEKLKAEAEAQVEAVKAQAEAQAEALKAEAEAKTAALKEEAKKQQAKLIEDAKSGNLDLESSKKSLGGVLGGGDAKGGEPSPSQEILKDPKAALGGGLGGLLGGGKKSSEESGDADRAAEPEAATDQAADAPAEEESEAETPPAPEEKKKGLGGLVPGLGGGDNGDSGEKKKNPLGGLF